MTVSQSALEDQCLPVAIANLVSFPRRLVGPVGRLLLTQKSITLVNLVTVLLGLALSAAPRIPFYFARALLPITPTGMPFR